MPSLIPPRGLGPSVKGAHKQKSKTNEMDRIGNIILQEDERKINHYNLHPPDPLNQNRRKGAKDQFVQPAILSIHAKTRQQTRQI